MKKYLMFGLLVSIFMVVEVAGIKVFAESEVQPSPLPAITPTSIGSVPMPIVPPSNAKITSPMILTISADGHILMRGTVESVGTDSLMVNSWGGSWAVKLSSTTNTMSLNRVISDFQVGDFVGVMGTVQKDGSFVIDAKIVRKWFAREDYKKFDFDHDGISNDQDTDDDNDGILDVNDSKPYDHDNDGIMDDQDTDDDNDGILDVNDSKSEDHDNDGVSDSQDNNDDNSGDENGDDNSGNENGDDNSGNEN